jgi:exonuclease SbcC
MIPVEIHIEGFLSYQEPVILNFESFHLACISGANGAGKSSILDAITWVLFGIARSRNDNIINQNSKNAEVLFDFEYEKQRFRILRSKTLEKSQILEFFFFDEHDKKFRVLTEHNSTETQKRINSTLRMDYDTFTNASFFLQGKADQFTQLTPGQRKEILSNILGLEIWETYREITKENRHNMDYDLNRIVATLEEIDLEISQEEQIRNHLRTLENELQIKSDLKNSRIINLNQARQLEQAQLNLKEKIIAKRSDLGRKKEQFSQRQARSLQLEEQCRLLDLEIKNAAEIEKDFQLWKAHRANLDQWEEKSLKYFTLQKEISEINQTVELKRNQLQIQVDNLNKEYQNIEVIQNQVPGLEVQIQDFNDQILLFEKEISKRDVILDDIEKNQQQLVREQESLKQLEQKNNDLREHLISFKNAGPNCPFCAQPLTASHRQQYEDIVKTEGVERKIKIDEQKEKIKMLTNSVIKLKYDLSKINDTEIKLKLIHHQKIEKDTVLKNFNETLTKWKEEKSDLLITLPLVLKNESFSDDSAKRLSILMPALKSLQYDPDAHQECKKYEMLYRSSEQKKRNLEIARSTLNPVRSQLIELKNDLSGLEKELGEKQTELTLIENEFNTQFSDIPDINQLQIQIDQLQIEISQIDQYVGAEKQKLIAIENNKTRQKSLSIEKNNLVTQIARHIKLEEAFSKNGIPALLIEQALPEIEDHANQLLEKLTGGAMSVYFQTQSDYKDKKRQDKKETLEILINDSTGRTRAYEMFSGGEAFRINFAIRMALSQVLAKRAGAQLQTLVIDEGFGSQDQEGRQRLIESINMIQSDFSKILVITHLDELKEAFPARIEVEKTSSGSKIEVQVF